MNCANPLCKAVSSPAVKFCPECGTPASGAGVSQHVSGGEGGISGRIYQAGGNIHIGEDKPESAGQYDAKWSWRSPVTMGILTWISVALGVLGVVAGWQGIAPLFESLTDNGPTLFEAPKPGWLITFGVAFLLLVVVLGLRKVTKHRTQHFSPISWLPALTGWGGRVGLARFTGDCSICGGSLKFYDKPTQWIVNLETRKRKVTERRMAAECVNNEEHCWTIDKTDGSRD